MLTTTIGFAGDARLRPPEIPGEDIVIPAPPVPDAAGGPARFAPALAVGVVAGAGMLVWAARSGMPVSPMMLMLPGMGLLSALAMLWHSGRGRGGVRIDEQRRRYLDHVDGLAAQLRDAAQRQLVRLTWMHPAPGSLWTLIGGRRMWERRAGDRDFGHVRLGLGSQRLCRRIVLPPVAAPEDLDPVTAEAFRRCVRAHAVVDDAPIALALSGVPAVVLDGDRDEARALARAMICQLAVLQPPDAVVIAAMVDPARRDEWDWLKWLPHNRHPVSGGPMVYDCPAGLEALGAETARPHMILLVDRSDGRYAVGGEAVTPVVIGATADTDALTMRLDAGRLSVSGEEFARPDALTVAQARDCARRLARYRVTRAVDGTERGALRVPLGRSPDGAVVDLDIKEAAQGGHGPHGLCVGATGSGKSELLRTVVVGMACRHSPDELNLVLVDFKGGATFLELGGLGHVAAIITNLSEDDQLVMRAQEALAGEIHRRQQLLRRAGNAVNLAAYRLAQQHDPQLPTLPSLLIVVDEFAELLHRHAEFADLFAMIGRVGRSLGVHLLLASQRLDEGRLRGLESHLSYRICLKTVTTAESRAVLGVPDAAELPTTPGAAFLRTADARLTRFQATYLGAPDVDAVLERGQPNPVVRQFTSIPAVEVAATVESRRTVLDALLGQLAGRGSPARQIWLPPLSVSPRLSDLPDTDCPELSAHIGLVDRPFEQRRVPLRVDTAGAGGHVAVVGAPRSGKSQTVCTLVTALAARHDPRRIQFYCLDFGGGALTALSDLPHVGSVAGRHDRDLVRATLRHVEAIVRSREGGHRDEFGDVYLVVDGWHTVRDEFGELETSITAMAGHSLSFGVHLILTAARWADIRPGLKDQIGTRIELRLGDPLDSEMNRKQAALVQLGWPGRGVTAEGHHLVIATSTPSDVTVRGTWTAPPVRLLPAVVDHAALLDETNHGAGVLLGIGEPELTPTALDVRRDPHLLIVGDRDCGKTSALRTVCREIVRGTEEQHIQLFVVDFRRSLLGVVDPAHLCGYAFSAAVLAETLPGLLALLRGRLPAADVTADQLRSRSWWSGPEIVVVIDDHELVSSLAGESLAGLVELLPHATDIGLHVIAARRCAGIARAMYDPLLAHLRDGRSPTLLMSGSPDEGLVAGGQRPEPQPPGRGLLVTSDGAQRIQVGWSPP